MTDVPVAICIPAWGSPRALKDTLESIHQSGHPAHLLEVVVAVDGPDEELAGVARSAGATAVVLQRNAGSYAARNAALDALRGPAKHVLFTDSDCRIAPGWVAAHLRALGQADASGGRVLFRHGQQPSPAEWVDASRHLRQQHFVEVVGFAATCNLAVSRAVVERLRFDDSLRSGGDFDFGVRLRATGFRLVYTPEAVVEHAARTSARAVLRKVGRVAAGSAANQARGADAATRRDPRRQSALAQAEEAGLRPGSIWRLQVLALDTACSLLYARHVPSVVAPALRRRLKRS